MSDLPSPTPGAPLPAAGAAAIRPDPDRSQSRDWALGVQVDPAEVDRFVGGLPARAAASAGSELDRLLRVITFIDLTTLSGDDTPERVRALCARAREPLPPATVARLGAAAEGLRTAAVCVHHHFLAVAKGTLEGSGIPVAVVAAGFPTGLSPLRQRIDEIRAAVDAGADEIDAVINRSHVLTGAWEALHDEVRAFREASGPARLKVILATGELATLENVARAARVCMLAGADFIKTSTGKEAVNATYPAGAVMLRAVVDYHALCGHAVGFKPAGGIRTPAQALEWMRLVEEIAGEPWLQPHRFRIGASGLLGEIAGRVAQLAGAGSGGDGVSSTGDPTREAPGY